MRTETGDEWTAIAVEQLHGLVTTMADAVATRDELLEILEVMANPVIVSTPEGTISKANQAACTLLGLPRDTLLGMEMARFIAEGEPWVEACMLTIDHQGSIRDQESWLLANDGRKIPVQLSVSALRTQDGKCAGYVCAARDLSNTLRVQEALRASMVGFQSIVEKSVDGILILEDDGQVGFANQTATEMLGRELTAMIGMPFGFPVMAGSVSELDVVRPNGTMGIVEMRTMQTRWQERDALLISLRDVTETIQLRDQLRQLSMEDALTGLNNRRGFFMLASQELSASERSQARFLLFFIDLDGMKSINDRLGHKFGDQALIETAGIMRRTFRKSDILARLGGDEFLAFSLRMEKDNAPAHYITARLEAEIARQNGLPGRAYALSLSIGHVEVSCQAGCDLEQRIREADAEMYRVKMAKKRTMEA
ncbi:MAG: diguanylate cyclase [Magnetococcales bacterium]|nr:diguanylate cyclase [Magnetococcales bacterium]